MDSNSEFGFFLSLKTNHTLFQDRAGKIRLLVPPIIKLLLRSTDGALTSLVASGGTSKAQRIVRGNHGNDWSGENSGDTLTSVGEEDYNTNKICMCI